MTKNIIQTVKITRIINECKGIRTFFFKLNNVDVPKPGQFVMIWVPGVDEIPMSISSCDDIGNWSITVKDVGECTKALYELKAGDYIGVRGPLGNYFKLPQKSQKHVFLVGGGIGMAPLKFLSQILKNSEFTFKVIEGAKEDRELIFIDEIFEITRENCEFLCCTDDGSYGQQGFATKIFENQIKEIASEEYEDTIVYTCGPEIMMCELLKICHKYGIEMHASLERIMRCGCGLCGLCTIDPVGMLVCKDGPIFNSEILSKMEDFGKNKRDFTGKKISLK
ncbi:MAG: dihydroorotate dehydrogenase electron transfer subunit [Promethearchaeota archaeon]